MAGTVSYTVDATDLLDQLRSLEQQAQTAILRSALRESAKPVRNKARQLAPKRSGRGARGIIARVTVKRGHGEAQIGWTKRRFYMRFQETGTKHHSAQPHLRPALDSSIGEVEGAFRRAAEAGIAAAIAKRAALAGGEGEFEVEG